MKLFLKFALSVVVLVLALGVLGVDFNTIGLARGFCGLMLLSFGFAIHRKD